MQFHNMCFRSAYYTHTYKVLQKDCNDFNSLLFLYGLSMHPIFSGLVYFKKFYSSYNGFHTITEI